MRRLYVSRGSANSAVRTPRDTIFVDPGTTVSTSNQTGSEERPFSTLGAAVAFANANASTYGYWLVVIPIAVFDEDFSITTQGIEIACLADSGAYIRGDITWTAGSGAYLQFRNCQLTNGTLTGSATAGTSRLIFTKSNVSEPLTISGAGTCHIEHTGHTAISGTYSLFGGGITTTGDLYLNGTHLSGAYTCRNVVMHNIGYQPGATFTINGTSFGATDCLSAPASVTFATVAGSTVELDSTSRHRWESTGTTSNAETFVTLDTRSWQSDGNATGAKAVSFAAGRKRYLTVTGNTTITLTPAVDGATMKLRITNGGAFTTTFAAAAGFTLAWSGGAAPAWTAAGTDIATFERVGTTIYGYREATNLS